MKGTALLALAGLSAIGALTPLAAHAAGLNEIAAYRLIAESEARRAGVPRQIVDAVMRVESGYNPMASGLAGEVGLMQILPGTAAMLGFRGTMDELREPTTNIRLGVAYLSQAWRLAGGDLCTTVMKYRAGHGETRFSYLSVEYCRRIRAHLATLGFPIDGPLPPATFGVPVPVITDAAFTADADGTAGPVKKKRDCFRRVAQPGKRFGACISKARFAAMGLLRGGGRIANSE
jgi:Transglycosylase SLT domain